MRAASFSLTQVQHEIVLVNPQFEVIAQDGPKLNGRQVAYQPLTNGQ